MLTEQRYEKILDLVNEKKSVTVKEMTELLESSESTIRRDLTVLHKKGRLVKVFGGAVAIDMEYRTKDEEVNRREDENKEAKELIARFAASLIQPDDFVFLDAGTTTAWIPDFLIEKSAVFVKNWQDLAWKSICWAESINLLRRQLWGMKPWNSCGGIISQKAFSVQTALEKQQAIPHRIFGKRH